MRAVNLLVVGVGGQGTLLASDVLAEVGVQAGYDVKKTEVHGMSQRGGSVNSHVRWGEKVLSPIIGRGEVDYLVALEQLEALRYLPMLRPGATALVGEFKIPPLSVSSSGYAYPDDAQVRRLLQKITDDVHLIPTLDLARETGTPRAHNVVLLGALSAWINQPGPEVWLKVITERVPPKTVDVNWQAFEAGRYLGASKR